MEVTQKRHASFEDTTRIVQDVVASVPYKKDLEIEDQEEAKKAFMQLLLESVESFVLGIFD